MKFGVILTAGDPRQTADLAALAEASGWDGVFTWDGISVGAIDTYDPWVVMAAWAMRTKRVTLGAIITHVLVHEIGHHFGLSDADMADIERAAG